MHRLDSLEADKLMERLFFPWGMDDQGNPCKSIVPREVTKEQYKASGLEPMLSWRQIREMGNVSGPIRSERLSHENFEKARETALKTGKTTLMVV